MALDPWPLAVGSRQCAVGAWLLALSVGGCGLLAVGVWLQVVLHCLSVAGCWRQAVDERCGCGC
eukprot:2845924-Alexandrium_andersonii.AAC.1